ncbi:MAG: phosphoribosylglycinamide formyltransferase [Deltaproteobacteria bacterium]|nr:phosphoribosylglycinamide formyltransferase [Deltaproteobacteria bacterium]
MAKKIRIGVLISGSGTNLQAISDSCDSGKINGDITFVGSDNPGALGIERSKKRGIATFVVDYRPIIQSCKKDPNKVSLPDDFDLDDVLSKQNLFSSNAPPEKVRSFFTTRAVAEAKLIDKMKPYPFDLLVLAGFMRNLTPYFIDRINTDPSNPRIMNIHPALLPSFPGVDGYGDTFRYGCKIGGCTIHFIDYGEDSGPIIGQRAFRITGDDTLERIKEKGLKLEWELYPECIELFARGRLKIVRMSYELENGKKIEKNVVKIL